MNKINTLKFFMKKGIKGTKEMIDFFSYVDLEKKGNFEKRLEEYKTYNIYSQKCKYNNIIMEKIRKEIGLNPYDIKQDKEIINKDKTEIITLLLKSYNVSNIDKFKNIIEELFSNKREMC